jgi:hypothetical protein
MPHGYPRQEKFSNYQRKSGKYAHQKGRKNQTYTFFQQFVENSTYEIPKLFCRKNSHKRVNFAKGGLENDTSPFDYGW